MSPDPHEDPSALLKSLFMVAVAEADPMQAVRTALPARPDGRVVVVGAGKAAARMAEAVEAVWGPCAGIVVTRTGHGRPTREIEVIEASHPVPDQSGVAATARMMSLLKGCGEGDTVLALISGGASALLVAPAEGLALSDKQAVTAALLNSGAPICQMNLVRKHLGRVKGGQLAAAAWPARVLGLLISDVPGDDPASIGSGPTVGEASTPAAAMAVLQRWGITPTAAVRAALTGPGTVVPPGDPRLSRTVSRVIATPLRSLEAAARHARAAGCRVEILGDAIEGEARDIAAQHAKLARRRQAAMQPDEVPLVLLSGGELTVTRLGGGGGGVGGPNAEYALAIALRLDGAPGIHAIACDTDGIDGGAPIAGAIIGPGTCEMRLSQARQALDGHDAHGFFGVAGGQVVTGPTMTNVNDFRAMLIFPQP